MYIDFSSLFHQSSKDRSGQGRVQIPLDDSLWPPEWKTISYKAYPRLPQITLSENDSTEEIWSVISDRSTRRDFSSRQIPIKDISMLLKYSCGIVRDDEHGYHRAQPSGGGRYPVEAYVLSFVETDDLASGVYHYNVRDHTLDQLWKRDFSATEIGKLFTYPWAQQASCALILTGVFKRNQMKYGERGYRQILIETGAIVQNCYLTSQALGLKCCAIDGVREKNIEDTLDIDGVSESVLCSVLIG